MSRVRVSFWLFQTKRKDKSYHPRWRFRYTGPDGRPATGTGFTDKSETRRLAQQMALEADEIRRGIRPLPKLEDTESLKQMSEHAEAYLDWGRAHGGRRGGPWDNEYARRQKRRLAWWIEKLKNPALKDISLVKVEGALKDRGGQAGATLWGYARTIHGFLTWCLDRDFLSFHPLRKLRQFDRSVTPARYRRALTSEEIGLLLSVAPEERRLIYHLALVTGYRRMEINSLCVGDLNIEKMAIHLHSENAKPGEEDWLALPEDLTAALARISDCRKEDQPLFPIWNADKAARLLDQDLRKAGIAKRNFHGVVDFHALRTTHINLGIDLGFDGKTSQTLARHKDPKITMNTYGRAKVERLRNAVNELGKVVADALSGLSQKAVKKAIVP